MSASIQYTLAEEATRPHRSPGQFPSTVPVAFIEELNCVFSAKIAFIGGGDPLPRDGCACVPSGGFGRRNRRYGEAAGVPEPPAGHWRWQTLETVDVMMKPLDR